MARVWARRRVVTSTDMDTRSEIDALARLLDGHAAPEASAEALALGALARSLGAAAPQPRAEFKSALRATLIDAARAQAASPPVLTRLRQSVDDTTARWRYSTRLAAATGAAALALSGGGVATATQRALPGDVFYGVRLGLEDARLALLGDDVARGTQRLAYAGERVEDARAATAAGDHDGAARALREADASARDAARELLAASQERGDRAVLDRLDLFTREQRTRLAALAPLLRGPASQAGDDALVTLGRIDARVAVMTGRCAACDVAGGRAADVDLAEILRRTSRSPPARASASRPPAPARFRSSSTPTTTPSGT